MALRIVLVARTGVGGILARTVAFGATSRASRNLDSGPIDASGPLGEAGLEGGEHYEQSQGILAGCRWRCVRARHVRRLRPAGAETRDDRRPARIDHRRARALRVPGSRAARAGHQRAARRSADARARSRAARGHGRARHRHPGAQRQRLLVVFGESRRCERGRRNARRRHRGLVQAAPHAVRRLELRSRCSFRISRPSSSSTP